jgi:hypothetical protein
MRHLIDPQGREWRVYERPSRDFAPGAGQTSLVFDAEGIVRRLWRYPPGWLSLSDGELLRLMEAERTEHLA